MSGDLNYQLRFYSAHHVKIQECDYEWAKSLVNKYVKEAVWDHISQNSDLPLRNLEYTGSQYEHLKTEAADEVDVMIILEGRKHLTVEAVDGVPGWAKLRVIKNDSPYLVHANSDHYILPEKMLSQWLFSIVTKAKNAIQRESTDLPVSFEVRKHGPAVQLDIIENSTEKKLSVDLVLSFGFDINEFYVAKPYKIKNPQKYLPCSKDILLRKSFSTLEKAKLKNMDASDGGCRHELLRIVKTIVKKDTALKGKLTTYHLKTAFLWLDKDESKSWHRDDLGERFLEYIQYLVESLKMKKLQNVWLPEVNLLEDIDDVVINNMRGRLQRLLSSESERSKVLKVPSSNLKSPQENTSQHSFKEGLLDLRKFLDDMGNSLSKTIKSHKDAFNTYIKDVILKRCADINAALISRFEYSGNLYENLITEGPDDDDFLVLVVLKKNPKDIIPILHDGFAEFKVHGPKYEQFSDGKGFVSPEKTRKWFFKIMREEAEKCRKEFGLDIKISQPLKDYPMKLEVKYSQSSCQENKQCSRMQAVSNVWVKKPSLVVSLMPVFEVEAKFFTPQGDNHSCEGTGSNWEQSFSLDLKAILQDMDKDGGCRHDLLKVAKTILKREPTFSNLLPHVKMIFVKFIKDSIRKWDKSKLYDRFEDFFSFLANMLKSKRLEHLWLKDVNLLSGIQDSTLQNMEKRVRRILSSDQERKKVLKLP